MVYVDNGTASCMIFSVTRRFMDITIKIEAIWHTIQNWTLEFAAYIKAIMTGTLVFEGVGAVRGLKPTDLASAKVSLTEGGIRVLEITDKDGNVYFLDLTATNIGMVASYIEIKQIARIEDPISGEDRGWGLEEIAQSLALFDLRQSNKLKYGM